MVTYFVPKETIEESKLREKEIPFNPFNVDGTDGFLVSQDDIEKFLNAFNCSINNESGTGYDGIHHITVKFNESGAVSAGPPQPAEIVTWNGSDGLKKFFLDACKELSGSLGKKVRLYVPHGRPANGLDNEYFNIFVWSGSKINDKDATSSGPERMWDIPVSCRDSSDFIQSDGIPIITMEGDCVGELVKDNLYIFHDCCHNGTQEEINLFKRFLQEAQHIMKHGARGIEELREMYKDQYVKLCKNRFKARSQTAERTIKEEEDRLHQLKEKTVTSIRRLKEAQIIIAALKNGVSEEDAKYAQEFDKLFTDKIKKVTCTGNTISAFTNVLFCEDPRTRKLHEIGEFRITLDINTGRVLWNNLTRKVDAYESSMHAPHIFKSGEACMGYLSEVLPELIANYEFAAVISLTIQFVESCNTDDPAGYFVFLWPIKGESGNAYKTRVAAIRRKRSEGQRPHPSEDVVEEMEAEAEDDDE